MTTFGEYLENCIRARDISINALSSACGINRGGLYNVFKQQRRLKPDQLYKLIAALGLSAREEERLTALYFEEHCGRENYRKITYFLNLLQNACAPLFGEPPKTPASGQNTELLAAVQSFVAENSRVITNYPFDMQAVDAAFFQAVKHERLQKFTHIFTFDENDNYRYNYRCIFSALKFMHLRHFPVYYTTAPARLAQDVLLPYFAVGEHAALLFSADRVVTVEEPGAVAALQLAGEAFAARCTPFGSHTEDLTEIMSIYQKYLTSGVEFVFTYYPCLAKFVDYKMMQEVVQPLPNKDMLVNLAYSHYSYLYSNVRPLQFTTEAGIRAFASTGNLMEVPQSLVQAMSVGSRIAVLQKMKQAALDGDLFLLNPDYFRLPCGIAIETCGKVSIFSGYDPDQPSFFEQDRFTAQITDSSLNGVIWRAADYLRDSHLTLSPEYAAQILENIIVELKNK